MAFGDADLEIIRKLEKQIEFREKQISKLTLKCSLMQIELEKDADQRVVPKKLKEKQRDRGKPEQKPPKRRSKSVVLPKEPTKEELSESSLESEESNVVVVESPRQKPLTVLELIKQFDDGEVGNERVNDLNMLSSLFIELKRLNQVMKLL